MGDFTQLLETIPEFGAAMRKEIYTNVAGTEIIVLTPTEGPVMYFSTIILQSSQGPLNVQFQMKVDSLEAACAAWQASARAAVVEIGEKMKENQRRIVLPGNPVANTMPPFAVKPLNGGALR